MSLSLKIASYRKQHRSITWRILQGDQSTMRLCVYSISKLSSYRSGQRRPLQSKCQRARICTARCDRRWKYRTSEEGVAMSKIEGSKCLQYPSQVVNTIKVSCKCHQADQHKLLCYNYRWKARGFLQVPRKLWSYALYDEIECFRRLICPSVFHSIRCVCYELM